MSQHGVRVLSERDRRLLRLIGEQYLVTLPQLAYLAGRSERTARWLRTRWQRADLVRAAPLLVEEPTVVWLTRRGLATVGLSWKEVRPSHHSVQSAAALIELRLAAAARYPDATWTSRRALSHAWPAEPPLPDALLETGATRVAVVVKLRTLDRRELDERVAPIVDRHDHTLLVLPTVGEHAADWIDEQAGRATALAFRHEPRTVKPPLLPRLPLPEHQTFDPAERQEEQEAGVALLRRREALLADARRDITASRRRDLRLGDEHLRSSGAAALLSGYAEDDRKEPW